MGKSSGLFDICQGKRSTGYVSFSSVKKEHDVAAIQDALIYALQGLAQTYISPPVGAQIGGAGERPQAGFLSVALEPLHLDARGIDPPSQ